MNVFHITSLPKPSWSSTHLIFLDFEASFTLILLLYMSRFPFLLRQVPFTLGGFLLEALGAIFARGNEVKSLLAALVVVLVALVSLLGRSWPFLVVLGAVFDRSWEVLGRSWNGLWPSWAVLRRSWSGLGPSWGVLGRFLGGWGS